LPGVETRSLGRVLAVSPHMDDAALSAGNFLHACDQPAILTVFGGIPDRYGELTEWDESCGFSEGDDVVALRRVEDAAAAANLGASARWLDFVDSQYRTADPAAVDVADRIASVAAEIGADTIALPLGIQHEDHRLTHDACMALLRDHMDLAGNWLTWVDIPYRLWFADQVTDRLESLRQQGFQLAPSEFAMTEAKRAALADYASQAKGLGEAAMENAARPEQLFVVTRR
jgi:LmbE family N-acetylglucosaminyl deacetylase